MSAFDRFNLFPTLSAPQFPSGLTWFNTKPLSLKDLCSSGHTVLVDFWTYSCVNCLRTLPYLKHWHEKYSGDGLVIVGVHTPEFSFEKSPHNVKEFLQQNKIEYPVVLDSDYKVWNVYANDCWPRKFLIDRNGRIRYDHRGEGDYEETEAQIQALLKETNRTLEFERITPEAQHLGGGVCYPQTPELYAGFRRGVVGNPEGFIDNKKFEYHYSGDYEDGRLYLEGFWLAEDERLIHSIDTKEYQDFITLRFHGLELNAVMQSKLNRGEMVVVFLNDKPIPKDMRGEDVVERDGGTFVRVEEPRMYKIIRTPQYSSHVLKLSPLTDRFEIYAFTFGGCFH